ncbi:LPXTG cell wall anchor domain-containing protein [Vagococcus intermedius]|uniref:LPXTG cell wall anchor domain-containing protein n=1 Tax=Vagococcus intermedius TaxID=2991418 RepID=A0AAF0CUD7_9ENTE|nr:LPXTG cell wall anchor domain-containing protein [Vagococcus intermedius]WEG73088.1 LPXTG cell wall anchor domain-containing protein [Vagococcus intermedius]WEG75172.1 LPXTG cell wall anchor domain-containing protein [Vagococcus intermedius]
MIDKRSFIVSGLIISALLISPILSSADSSASVTFLPNPSLPLYPEEISNKESDKVEPLDLTHKNKPKNLENDKQGLGRLPQTGEKSNLQIYGELIVISTFIIGYLRKKILNNKAIKSRTEEL